MAQHCFGEDGFLKKNILNVNVMLKIAMKMILCFWEVIIIAQRQESSRAPPCFFQQDDTDSENTPVIQCVEGF